MAGRSSDSKMQFFKVLMPGFSERMMIPREFTKFIAHKKRMMTTILSPLNQFWHVKLSLYGSDLFFSNGWKEFAQAHGLAIGWFLVFRYEGNMVFTVKVFDLSGCLKNYDENDDFRHSTMPGEESLKKNKINAKPTKCKEEYIECSNKVDMEEGEEGEDDNEEEEKDVNEIQPKSDGRKSSFVKARQANTFVKTIRPYNIQYNKIGVPKDFCIAQGLTSKQYIVLKDTKERSWQVLFCLTKSNGNFFRKGWADLCKANNVKSGDRCVFQLESKGMIRVCVLKH